MDNSQEINEGEINNSQSSQNHSQTVKRHPRRAKMQQSINEDDDEEIAKSSVVGKDQEEEKEEQQGSQQQLPDEAKNEQKQQYNQSDMIRISYYRWMFFFFFFHFFDFICTTDILNEFGIYLENKSSYKAFTKKYPNILPTLNTLLSFNIMVLVGFVGAFLITFRFTLKTFYLLMGVYIGVYIGKLVCCFASITIENEMNKTFSRWYEQIKEDDEKKYCGLEDYNRCRITFAWNFFKYQVIFDVIVTTITYLVYLFKIRKYKLFLLDELNAKYAQLPDQNAEQNPGSNADLSQIQNTTQKPLNEHQNEQSLNDISRNDQSQIIENKQV